MNRRVVLALAGALTFTGAETKGQDFELSKSVIKFGSQVVGTESEPKTFRVTTNDNTDFRVSSTESAFKVNPRSFPGPENEIISVVFAPRSVKDFQGVIRVESGGEFRTLDVFGTGEEPGPLEITTAANLPESVPGEPYEVTLSAEGGVPPYTWSGGSLGLGLSIARDTGTIAGTPIQAGAFRRRITVRDNQRESVTKDFFFTFTNSPVTNVSVPGGGARTLITRGDSDLLKFGYAAIDVQSDELPYGVAVFSTSVEETGLPAVKGIGRQAQQARVVISEAGVPASPPTTRARVFIDLRKSVTLATPLSEGPVSVTTGVAVVNPGQRDTTITYTLRDGAGNSVAVGRASLSAGTHTSALIESLQEIAQDFRLPDNFAAEIQFGSLDLESDEPVSVMALRGSTNQRGELLLTSTPVADLEVPPSAEPVLFPHLADSGGRFTTLVFLMNNSANRQMGTLEFFGDNGEPLDLTRQDGSIASSFPYTIPPDGVFVFESNGSASELKAGWMRVRPRVRHLAPVGAGAFQVFNDSGTLISESGIPSAALTKSARVYIDQSGGHLNGVAIANPSDMTASVTLRSFELDGSTPAGSAITERTIAALGHDAGVATDFITGLPECFRGVFEITSDVAFVALNLRALVNSRDDLLLTTFPIADATREAASPVVFPHFADGGPFQTELILQSPGDPVEVGVRWIEDNGARVEADAR